MCFSRPRNEKGLKNSQWIGREFSLDEPELQPCRLDQRPFEWHKLNQYICCVIASESCFLAKPWLLIHVSSRAPAQGWKLLLGWVKLNPHSHGWTCNNMDLWAIFIYFSFICCKAIIMGKCASGLDLSHRWNYNQPFSSGCLLSIPFCYLCNIAP